MKLKLLEYVHENLPKGVTPYYLYAIIEKVEVGRITLRVGNEELYEEGHIGYTIYPEYRGHHYAYQACLLLKEFIDRDEVYITCDPSNLPSLKTIERLGCEYIETKTIPFSKRKFFSKDEKEKMIFKWKVRE